MPAEQDYGRPAIASATSGHNSSGTSSTSMVTNSPYLQGKAPEEKDKTKRVNGETDLVFRMIDLDLLKGPSGLEKAKLLDHRWLLHQCSKPSYVFNIMCVGKHLLNYL